MESVQTLLEHHQVFSKPKPSSSQGPLTLHGSWADLSEVFRQMPFDKRPRDDNKMTLWQSLCLHSTLELMLSFSRSVWDASSMTRLRFPDPQTYMKQAGPMLNRHVNSL
jgi:hypothetical protein